MIIKNIVNNCLQGLRYIYTTSYRLEFDGCCSDLRPTILFMRRLKHNVCVCENIDGRKEKNNT